MKSFSITSILLQGMWLFTCLKETIKFKKASKRPLKQIQIDILKEILSNSTDTLFAKKYNFDGISSIKEFQKNIPICDYEDMEPWIKRIAEGERRVLTNSKVLMFEETSGSTSASKLIPYNPKLQEAFNRALHPWLVDLYFNNLDLFGGPSYWVITPKSNIGRKTKGGVPVGFAADSEYFGRWGSYLVDLLMAVPSSVATVKGVDPWKYATILSLLRCENLKMISMWNPTFLSSLLKETDRFAERLISDLETGKCSCCPNIKSLNASKMPIRALQFKRAIKKLKKGNFCEFSKVMWPNLALISSWTENEAKDGANRIKLDFPHVKIQTKGILSTEGAITIPMTSAPAPVLAVRSAFFEFIEIGSTAKHPRLAHELEQNKKYSVLMTTFGGLFRYRLNDIVQVRGFWNNLPCFKFISKENKVVDLCGEKLNEGHVKDIIFRILKSYSGVFIAPERSTCRKLPGYNLFISSDRLNMSKEKLQTSIETELKKNFHYNWCLETGQLRKLVVCVIDCSIDTLNTMRIERNEEVNHKFSTSKLRVLTNIGNWTNWFISKKITFL